MKKTVIVFAPHPDDEILGCGGTIAKKLNEGFDVSIVFMTDGRNALSKSFGITSEPTPYELAKIRKEEAKRAAKIVGVREENLIFLNFKDGMLEKKERIAQDEVIKILNKKSPVEVYFPYERDFHPDHRVTNKIVRSSIRRLCLHPLEYQYTTVKYTKARTLESIISLKETMLALIKHRLIHIDVSRFLPLKKMAIKQYKTQITIFSNKQRRPVLDSSLLKRFLKNEEPFFINISVLLNEK